MHTVPFRNRLHFAGAALLVALLAGCQKPPAPGEEPQPAAPPAPQAAVPAPVVEMQTVKLSMDAQRQVAATPVPAATPEPPLSSMALATASSKLGVPADLRYSFDGDVSSGQAVTLHLAAVPHVAGSNLAVSIKQEPGIRTSVREYRAEKAIATSAYRQQLSITRDANGPQELRVVVTMDMPIGSAFTYFSVPLAPPKTTAKEAPVEMR